MSLSHISLSRTGMDLYANTLGRSSFGLITEINDFGLLFDSFFFSHDFSLSVPGWGNVGV